MKILPLLTMLPALSMAGQISGKVSDLDGRPLAGVEVQGRHESDISKPSGAWTVGMALGYAPKKSSSNGRPSSLSLHDRRLELSWTGHDLKGRRNPRGISPRVHLSALRTAQAAPPETLWVFWKGKRLAQVPLNSGDTSGVKIRIDTAWGDDGGFPWNPRVTYGSLHDSRDGNTYRTVKIGDTRWMAEGLRFDFSLNCSIGCSWILLKNLANVPLPDDRWGTLYFQDLQSASLRINPICPAGWRLPTQNDLWQISVQVEQRGFAPFGQDLLMDSLWDVGYALRATSGWPDGWAGGDQFGFRLLPSGEMYRSEAFFDSTYDGGETLVQGRSGGFWLWNTWSAHSGGGTQFRTGKYFSRYASAWPYGYWYAVHYTEGAAEIRCLEESDSSAPL